VERAIEEVFTKKKRLKVMTHVVAGYPDLETSRNLILAMAEAGADMIEVQIPFSDPLADGATIMAANHKALQNGLTPRLCLKMVEEIKDEIKIPLLFMTYVNLAYALGFDRFLSESAAVGVSGLIIPDLPFDERDYDQYYSLLGKYRLCGIQVLSAGLSRSRLQRILKMAQGFIYITLRVGVTGAREEVEKKSADFIDQVRAYTDLPLAAGFGISSVEQIRGLAGQVDMAVIGSHLINLFNSGGIESVQKFIKEANEAIDQMI
jgi:tryptophan synthase alpha chain